MPGAVCSKRVWVQIAAYSLACFLGVPSVFAQKVQIEFDHDADFSRIRSYEWRTHPIFEKRPELKEQYATGIQLVLQAGNEEMRKRGLQPAEASPDVFVTFFLSAANKQREQTVIDPAQWWSAGYGWYTPPAWITKTEYYTDGMLLIDMVDAATSKLIWSAYCTDTIRDFRARDKNIRSAVRKAFEKFPPKTK